MHQVGKSEVNGFWVGGPGGGERGWHAWERSGRHIMRGVD